LVTFLCVEDKFLSNNVSQALHPYFKLEYIKKHWGGEEEQEQEPENGNLDARNLQNEAQKVVERVV
jgi:hypothetical protein